ncbi:hypothetical protein GUJ93_ZPchr0001g30626 [Zizania palustris]|uniref:eIF3a PCI domain-containing protein n=1 Tax=Zizania palustris TaxID=103762 RepID=A0A8J5R851_ZIZPA|nr:hypothetical protein GUJ93_ZPchr0001g30626 [Zizania palustris]
MNDGIGEDEVFSRLFAKKEMQIFMVSLDTIRETTILYKLKFGEIVTTIPTIGVDRFRRAPAAAMSTFAKPENALKRAEELIHVGQKQAALQALHDLITSKRYRSWQKPLEKIMMKYVELCVDLRKGRTVLEILRNNSKLEGLYAMTAHKAFQFCKQYKRTTEFRRLCEIIRNHLANLNKYRDQRDRPDLTAQESLQLYLDTRVDQLKIATELSLWQKSYNKNLSQKDLQLIASSVLLAALSVSPYDHKYGASHFELENEKDRNLRIANLVNFSLDSKRENREMPSRASLLSELLRCDKCIHFFVVSYNRVGDQATGCQRGDFLCFPRSERFIQPIGTRVSSSGSCIQSTATALSDSKTGGKLSSAPSVPEVLLSQYLPTLEKLTALRILQQDVTKQAVMELALNEQLKERQELEKKLQKLAKTMDYLERAKGRRCH